MTHRRALDRGELARRGHEPWRANVVPCRNRWGAWGEDPSGGDDPVAEGSWWWWLLGPFG